MLRMIRMLTNLNKASARQDHATKVLSMVRQNNADAAKQLRDTLGEFIDKANELRFRKNDGNSTKIDRD